MALHIQYRLQHFKNMARVATRSDYYKRTHGCVCQLDIKENDDDDDDENIIMQEHIQRQGLDEIQGVHDDDMASALAYTRVGG